MDELWNDREPFMIRQYTALTNPHSQPPRTLRDKTASRSGTQNGLGGPDSVLPMTTSVAPLPPVPWAQ